MLPQTADAILPCSLFPCPFSPYPLGQHLLSVTPNTAGTITWSFIVGSLTVLLYRLEA